MLSPRDWPHLFVLERVVRCGSFVGAARELKMSKSVVSDSVRALEERCEVRLLARTTRRLELTGAGERVLAAAEGLLEAGRAVNAVLEDEHKAPTGTLRVATTQDLAARVVGPSAARVVRSHRRVTVEIVADDAQRDLVAERIDIAVRLGVPRDSSFGLRKLGQVVEPVVGAPQLAARYEGPRPADLKGAPWVRHTLIGRPGVLRLVSRRGEAEEVPVDVRASVNSAETMRALVLAGAGFAAIPEYLVRDDLARGALVRRCPDWVQTEATLHAVLPSPRRTPPRVAAFLAELREEVARLASQGW
ncbi:MAG: LysR family transcriptional regulator [Polyangiaceae bacterium]